MRGKVVARLAEDDAFSKSELSLFTFTFKFFKINGLKLGNQKIPQTKPREWFSNQ